MYEVRYAFGPPGSPGTPGSGPGSPDGPHGPGVDLGGGAAPPATGGGTGTPPLMQVVPQGVLDPVRITQATNLMARVYNSLVYWGIVKLKAGQPADRSFVIDPTASPLFPGSGLTVRANTPGTYGTFT